MSLDLNLLPLSRADGLDQSELPGLYAAAPPRRTARGRNADRLILHFSMTGNAPLSAEQQGQILARLAETYFQTPGAVTAATRAVAEALNQFLLDRNRRTTSNGRQGIGMLSVAVVRDETLILGQSGPTHAFVITPRGVQYLYDPELSGRGLGVSRTAPIRYFQAQLHPGDLLLLTSQLAPGWSETSLNNVYSLGLESLRRRLISHSEESLDALVVQAQPGNGKLRILRPKAGSGQQSAVSDQQSAVGDQQSAVSDQQSAVGGQPSTVNRQPSTVGDQQSAVGGQPLTVNRQQSTVNSQPPVAASPPGRWIRQPSPPLDERRRPSGAEKASETAKPARPRPSLPKLNLDPLKNAVASIGRALGNTLRAVSASVNTLMRRVLPDESLLQIPPSTMIFFAIAVPVILAVIGGFVYIRRGRAEQFQLHYHEAAIAAVGARQMTDMAEQRTAWNNVLSLLDDTETYGKSADSQALRGEANAALDQIQWIQRLDYQPAITGIGSPDASMLITHMAATADELFYLNSTQGNVRRATFNGSGYDVDTRFFCNLPTGSDPIVDIIALPRGNTQNAVLMGMDANGMLIFCAENGEAPRSQQMAPPHTNWGSPNAFTLDTGDLFVLDPPTNAVWIFRAMSIDVQPQSFFSEEIPANMQNAVDLAVNRDDLYLLHTDSTLTFCTFSGFEVAPTRCTDNTVYNDPRPGYTSGPFVDDALFSQILYTPPPESSLYLLDAKHQAIYRFSMQLTLHSQYRPVEELSGGAEVTAFTVTPNRRLIIAIGNQIFYANLP